MKKYLKNTEGITLISLVITIIILLILAAISIQALTNQGLFGRANDAKRESEIANIKEQIQLDIYEKQLEPPVGSITEEQLKTILEKHGTVIYEEDGVTIKEITTDKGYEILLKDIYGGETVAESVPDGATVTPVNDITIWLKTGEISKQYSYTTIKQVIADSTCTKSLMNNENAMKYLARSTEFADAICASETTMTYLGDSAYVDDTVLNSDIWMTEIINSNYMDQVLVSVIPTMTSNDCNGYSVTATAGHTWSGYTSQPYYAFNGIYNKTGTGGSGGCFKDWYSAGSTSVEGQFLTIKAPKALNARLIQWFEYGNPTDTDHPFGIGNGITIKGSKDNTNYETLKQYTFTDEQLMASREINIGGTNRKVIDLILPPNDGYTSYSIISDSAPRRYNNGSFSDYLFCCAEIVIYGRP